MQQTTAVKSHNVYCARRRKKRQTCDDTILVSVSKPCRLLGSQIGVPGWRRHGARSKRRRDLMLMISRSGLTSVIHRTRREYQSLTKQKPKHYLLYLVAGILVLPLTCLIAHLLPFDHQPSSIAHKPGFASRCSQFPADCETTAPFIFDSIYSLAKQWPSTYGSNGHSIVPVRFPRHMPLYHAKSWEGNMKKPTWFAFDACVSFGM